MDELALAEIAAWSELANAERAPTMAMAMAMLPQFVLPAARWLTPGARPLVYLLERHSRTSSSLLGVVCLTVQTPSLFCPLPHLRFYRTKHSFRSGTLAAAADDEAVARAFVNATGDRQLGAQVVAMHNVSADSLAFQAMVRHARDRGGAWFELRRQQRPVLNLRRGQATGASIKSSAHRDLARRRRRLAEAGRLELRVREGVAALGTAVETHLALEHGSWKGRGGTSMLSSEADASFFREMVKQFAPSGQAIFVELVLDDVVIASTSNFRVGKTLSAFKIGWHGDYAKFSPGRLCELALLDELSTRWPEVEQFDSNAGEDSYLVDLLPHRDPIVTGFLACNRLGASALRAARLLRPLAYRLGRES